MCVCVCVCVCVRERERERECVCVCVCVCSVHCDLEKTVSVNQQIIVFWVAYKRKHKSNMSPRTMHTTPSRTNQSSKICHRACERVCMRINDSERSGLNPHENMRIELNFLSKMFYIEALCQRWKMLDKS